MKRKDFNILVTRPDDIWDELWVEIYYNNDIPIFIIQEEVFYEAILYHGYFEFITLPLDELITTLQEAKIFLPGNEKTDMEVYQTNRELFESTQKSILSMNLIYGKLTPSSFACPTHSFLSYNPSPIY